MNPRLHIVQCGYIGGELAYWFYSNELFATQKRDADTEIARRIVVEAGGDPTKYSSEEVRRQGALRLRTLADDLRAIIDSSTSDEPALLRYFKEHPEAHFAIEPNSKTRWREVSLQDYGQIDFVFELYDGRFRVVEIESPRQSLFQKRDEFMIAVHHARNQVNEWIRGLHRLPDIRRRRFGDSPPEGFYGTVIIGRSRDINNSRRREAWYAERDPILLTWDDVLSQTYSLADRLQNPPVADAEWAKIE